MCPARRPERGGTGGTPPPAALDPLGTKELVELLEERPTVTIEQAGRVLGLSRPAAYRAANKGEIHALKFGRRKVVPSAWLRRVLMLDDDPPAGDCISPAGADSGSISWLCRPPARERGGGEAR